MKQRINKPFTTRQKIYLWLLLAFAVFFAIMETTNAHAIITDGLVSYYSMDTVVGSTIVDTFGIKNCTSVGTTNNVTGKINNGIRITSATGQYLDCGSPTSTPSLTIALWANATSYSTFEFLASRDNDTASSSRIWFFDISASGGIQGSSYNSAGSSTTITATATGNLTNNGKMHFFVMTVNSSENKMYLYEDGVLVNSGATPSGAVRTDINTKMYIGNRVRSDGSGLVGWIDEVGLWNRSLSGAEVLELYNNGSGVTFSINQPIINISLSSRFPADITDTSLFVYPTANFTYQYHISNLTSAYANYSLFTYGTTCVNYVNGSCYMLNGTWSTMTQLSNTTIGNYSNITYSFTENSVYPATSNLDSTQIGLGITTVTLTGNNNFYADEILNLSSNTRYNIYEVPLLSSGVTEVYYYNSTYGFSSNPLTNANVHLLCTFINPTSYNHSHSGGAYGHQLCPYTVNASGFVGTVKFNGGGFLIRGNAQGVNLTVATTGIRNNVLRFTNNGGNTWSSFTTPLVSHVHQYTGNDTFNIKGSGVFSGVLQSTAITSDNLDITPLQPEASTILIPNGTGSYQKFMNITWEQAIPTSPGAYISNYTLQVFDSSFVQLYNITTVGNTTFNYVWNTYNFNLSVNTPYIIGIKANQNDSQFAYSFSGEFNVTTNAEINISAKAYNSTIINNFTVSLYYNNTYLSNHSTTTGSTLIDIIRGNNYTYLIQPFGYEYKNVSLINNNITSQYQFTLYTKNSLNISIYDEITKSLISNSKLELISEAFSFNYSSTTGRYYIDLLTPSSYSLRYFANGYSLRTYEFTLLDNTYNELNLTLLNTSSSTNVTIIVLDNLGNKLPNAIIKVKKFDLSTNSYPIDQIVTTNFEGKTTADIILNNEYYKFIIEYDGEVVLSTEKSYIYGNTVTFQVSLGGAGFNVVFENEMLSGNITTNNGIAKFTYNDESNTATQACFKIYSLSTINKILYNSSCTSITSGDINLYYSNTTYNTYVLEGYITVNSRDYLVASKTINLMENLPEQGKGFGLLITFILIIVTIFMLRFSLPVAVIVGSSIPLFMSMTHLNSISIEASSGIFLLGLVIAYIVGSR